MKEKNNVTEIVFIIDKSGSMSGLERDTIGGFNSTVEKQKRKGGTAYVSTVLFDTETRILHDRVPIEEVKPMTLDDYCAGGCTALLDAVGGAIRHIGNIHKYARREDVPEHTIFVITTDGMENASHIYDKKTVKKQIERQTEEHGWEFIFLGANIDSAEAAQEIGIRRERAMNYNQDRDGIEACYCAMECAISMTREKQSLDSDLWKKSILEDNKKRR